MPTEQDLIAERKRKVADLRVAGINPYPYRYEPTHHATDVQKTFSTLAPEEQSAKTVKVAGRIVGLRRIGKLTFMHVQDQDDKVQVLFKQETLGEEKYGLLKLLDVGDWLGAQGEVFKTKTGEITIHVSAYELLCKSLRPLPEKWHGLQDTELRYRYRYLDLITNPETKKTMMLRSKILLAMREFFHEKGFLEVETPVLQTNYGGANARPFITHHHDLDMNMYLRICLEIPHKHLLVGGFEKIFEINHVFRNESMDREHNPEFTEMECYMAYADYHDVMELTEDLYTYVAKKVLGTTLVNYQGKEINVAKPWQRITMLDAIKKYAGIDAEQESDSELIRNAKEKKVELPANASRGMIIAELFGQLCEQHLIQPTFVTDHPIETTPLCKPLRNGMKNYVERFEAFVNGWEMANAYSELNDPILQRQLLEAQEQQRKEGNEEAQPMDEDFVRAIEQGMPPAGGLGVGVDRMIMLMLNQPSIRDVILFPTMKPEEK